MRDEPKSQKSGSVIHPDERSSEKGAVTNSLSEQLIVERYKFVTQQLHATNENTHKFLAVYQTLASALVTGALAVFAGHKKWEISINTAKASIIGFVILETIVAGFAILLILAGVASWFDYRREENFLSDSFIEQDFRKKPSIRSFWRWYETYVILFIANSTLLLWFYTLRHIIPNL